jgi:phage baseplate assembly protein gpV
MVVRVPDIEIFGNIKQTGSNAITGDVTVIGGFNQSGGVGSVSGGWTVDGVTYLGHTHTNGNDGNPTGGVIV